MRPRGGGVYPPLFFVSADSKEVRRRRSVSEAYKGVEVPLEGADAQMRRVCGYVEKKRVEKGDMRECGI